MGTPSSIRGMGDLQRQNSLFSDSSSTPTLGSGPSTPFSELMPTFGNLNLGSQQLQQSKSASPGIFGLQQQPLQPQRQLSSMFGMQQQQQSTTAFVNGQNTSGFNPYGTF